MMLGLWGRYTPCCSCSTLNDIPAFDSIDPLCFMIDDAFNFRLVARIYDGISSFSSAYRLVSLEMSRTAQLG